MAQFDYDMHIGDISDGACITEDEFCMTLINALEHAHIDSAYLDKEREDMDIEIDQVRGDQQRQVGDKILEIVRGVLIHSSTEPRALNVLMELVIQMMISCETVLLSKIVAGLVQSIEYEGFHDHVLENLLATINCFPSINDDCNLPQETIDIITNIQSNSRMYISYLAAISSSAVKAFISIIAVNFSLSYSKICPDKLEFIDDVNRHDIALICK